MPYRLALDVGANSIGWCLLDLNGDGAPCGIRDLGVRVFPDGRDPKTLASLAADRRLQRGIRRRRDRYLQRRAALLNALTRLGLMPKEPAARQAIASRNPYGLRRDALHRKLAPEELGRVIFHLNQRRGFQSNRKTDRSNQEERGKIAAGADALKAEIAKAGSPTLGVWLAERHARGEEVRARLAGAGAKAAYPFYPTRDLVRAEFDAVWSAQAAWNPALTDAMREDIARILFHQRPLRAPPVARCWLEPGERRAPKALPVTQAFRIAQELANLAIHRTGEPDQRLTAAQRAQLAAVLEAGEDLTWHQLRKRLGLTRGETFNLESKAREKLKGAGTAARFAGKKGPLAAIWPKLDAATRDGVALALLEAETPEQAVAALVALGIPREVAEAAERVPLPEGHAALSAKAMRAILAAWQDGMTYDKALQAAGYRHHSDDRDGVIHDRLPYYGAVLRERLGTGNPDHPQSDEEKHYGRAPNPTVHVALNQLRHVVNAMLARHGHPAEIVVEVLRELNQSAFERRRIEKEQAENARNRERWAERLRELGQRVNGRNLAFMRLWHEQAKDGDPKERVCPYTGERISLERLFSGEVEEDHILPFSISLDDGFANRVLCMKGANRRKTNQTPFQAFGAEPQWPAILERAALLPTRKAWRFSPDALERWKGEHAGFLDRHLTDSAYLARLARLYLRAVCNPDKVRCVPGRLTALLRNALGLNSAALLGKGGARKDRTDHRHHAIDALTIGLIDQEMLRRVATAAGRGAELGRLLDDLPEPWPGFVEETAARLGAIVISYKPDTAPAGRLLQENPFGKPRVDRGGGRNLRRRRSLNEIRDWRPSNNPKKGQPLIEDLFLRARLDSALVLPDSERERALAALTDGAGHRVRRLRAAEAGSAITIRHGDGNRFEKQLVANGNHRVEFWRLRDGSRQARVVALLEAAREASRRGPGSARVRPVSPDGRVDPCARLMLELHKGDVVAQHEGAERRLLIVKSIWAHIVEFADLHLAKPERGEIVRMAPNTIMRSTVRKVRVDPVGRVFDPGPLAW